MDWNRTCEQLYNQVRGLSPYPAAWTTLTLSSGEEVSPVKVFKASKLAGSLPVGKMDTDGKTYIHIGCADGLLSLDELQFPGKKLLHTAKDQGLALLPEIICQPANGFLHLFLSAQWLQSQQLSLPFTGHIEYIILLAEPDMIRFPPHEKIGEIQM